MPNPACQVKDGAGSYVSTDDGVDVTPANTITINLIDTSADSWSIECVYTDETSVAATVTSSLVIDSTLRTATFTAPAAGKTYIFRSRVNNGIGPNGRPNTSYTTTFGVYTLTTNGDRVLAANETTEGGAFGWVKPVNNLIRNGGGGGGGSGSNLGSKLEVFKDVNAGTFRHNTIDVTANIKKSGNQNTGSNTVELRPLPPGHYNPCDYGAEFDDETDDYAAIQACLDDMPDTGGVLYWPQGTAWCSDTLRISKAIILRSPGGGNNSVNAAIEVPAGRIALQFDRVVTSLDGNSSDGHRIDELTVASRLMVHPTANGSALGRGIAVFTALGQVRVGECFVKASNVSPTRMYRATSMTANSGKGPGAFGASAPAWSTTVGSTVVDNGITWTTEAIPQVRANSTAYAVGDRVVLNNDNRFYFECTVAGTSAASPPTEMLGGDLGAGQTILGTFSDGGVTWQCKVATGVLVLSNLGKIGRVYAKNFNGPAVTLAGGTGQYLTGATVTDTNCFEVKDVHAEYCGLGIYTSGDNCNGWKIDRLFGINFGMLQPTPNAAVAASYTGLGGHGLHDSSLAAGSLSNLYIQTSTGRPVLKNGLGRLTLVSCFQELPADAHCVNGATTIIGGNVVTTTTSNSVVIIDPTGNNGRGISEKDATGPVAIRVVLSPRDGRSLLALYAPESGDPNFYAYKYGYNGPSGWWAFQHGNQGLQNAYLLSTVAAGTDPGPGWFCLPLGHLLGDIRYVNPIFRGERRAWTDYSLRLGLRRAGDTYDNSTTKISVLANGYKGVAWTASTSVTAGNSSFGVPPTVVEPTANTGKREGGEQVWKCTTGGTTHSSEPAWPGSPTPGVTTVTETGGVVWTYVGTTPVIEVEQQTSKAKLPARTKETTTTLATASQVIFDGGTSDGVPLDLPPDSMVIVSDLITIKKASTANGGSIKIESTWVRDGTAAPVQIGTSTITYNLSGSTLDGTTVAHAANGNKIELRGSPESADSLKWRVFRVQYEGTD